MGNLEKRIKDRLHGSELNVNTDELWKEVYPHIKPKRNRRLFLYLLLGVFWAISLIAVAIHFNQADEIDKIALNSKIDNEGKLSKNIIIENPLDEGRQVRSTSLKSELDESELEETNSPNKTYNISSPSKFLDSGTQSDPEQFTKIKQLSEDKMLIPPTSSLAVNANDLLGTNALQNLILKPPKNETLGQNQKKDKLYSESFLSLDSQQLLSSSILNNDISILKYNYPQPLLPNDLYSEYNTISNLSAFSIYVVGGYSQVDKLLTKNPGTTTNNLQSRLESESPLESISGELGVRYAIHSNLILSAGLNYTRINEKVADSYSRTDTVLLENVIIENIITSRGSEPVYGNIQAERTIMTDLRAYNRYSDLSVSFDLIYLLGSDRLMPYASVGLQHSITSMQTGYWLLDENILYDIAEDKTGYLSENYGLGLRFGAGVNFQLSDRSSFMLGGKYLKYVGSVTNESYELNQKYNLLGLNAGINFKL